MIVERMSFWIVFLIAGGVLYYTSNRRGLPLTAKKGIMMTYVTVAAFLVGFAVDISLTALFFSEASSSFSWKRILDFIYLGVLAVVVVYLGKNLINRGYLGDVGYLLLAFSTGVICRSIVGVL